MITSQSWFLLDPFGQFIKIQEWLPYKPVQNGWHLLNIAKQVLSWQVMANHLRPTNCEHHWQSSNTSGSQCQSSLTIDHIQHDPTDHYQYWNYNENDQLDNVGYDQFMIIQLLN